MDHDQAMQALHAGELVEAVITPAKDANGWVLLFTTAAGQRVAYTGHTGTEKTYHALDHATDIARELGFQSIRVEESF
ncbi:MAG: thymidylate kinase [Pseudomonadota bacterium]|nr:thymidylate kinase [Pseudomonadota bacterium]